MIPTEWEGTVAVDAAARVAYAQQTSAIAAAPPFEALEPLQKNAYRELVLPLVWAALEALNRPESTTVTEWALLAADGTIFDGADEGLRWTREQAQYAMEVGGDGVEPDALICRQHTSYADHVTDWSSADGSEP